MELCEMTLEERAGWARSFLTRRGESSDLPMREADGIGPILVGKHGCPKEVANMIYDLHDGMPCDWIYEMVGDALDAVEEYADQYHDGLELDCLHPTYFARRAWHANSGMVSGFDPYDWDIGPSTDPDELIAAHMQATLTYIGDRVFAWLENLG